MISRSSTMKSGMGMRSTLDAPGRAGAPGPSGPGAPSASSSGQEVHRVRDLVRRVGEAAVEVTELVTEVGHDVVALRLDVLARERLVLGRGARLAVVGGAARLQVGRGQVLEVHVAVVHGVARVAQVGQRAGQLRGGTTGQEEHLVTLVERLLLEA